MPPPSIADLTKRALKDETLGASSSSILDVSQGHDFTISMGDENEFLDDYVHASHSSVNTTQYQSKQYERENEKIDEAPILELKIKNMALKKPIVEKTSLKEDLKGGH